MDLKHGANPHDNQVEGLPRGIPGGSTDMCEPSKSPGNDDRSIPDSAGGPAGTPAKLSLEEQQQLVMQYAPLVKRIAYHLMAKLPASVQAEDIIQNGMLGLIDAVGRFEAGLGAQFETYAVQRIRGAMLDGLRENDWLPRSLRRDMRRIEGAVSQLEQRYGRQPTEGELAKALDMALGDYQKMLQEARGYVVDRLRIGREVLAIRAVDLQVHKPGSDNLVGRAVERAHARDAVAVQRHLAGA